MERLDYSYIKQNIVTSGHVPGLEILNGNDIGEVCDMFVCKF